MQVLREPSVSSWPRQGAKRTATGTAWMTSRWLWKGFRPWAVSIRTEFRIQADSSLRCGWAWQKAKLPCKTLYVCLVTVSAHCCHVGSCPTGLTVSLSPWISWSTWQVAGLVCNSRIAPLCPWLPSISGGTALHTSPWLISF